MTNKKKLISHDGNLMGGRHLPLFSKMIIQCFECILFVMNWILKILHLSSYEPALSTFIIGGFFGLAMIPIILFYMLFQLPQDSILFQYMDVPILTKQNVTSSLTALALFYIVTVLIHDKSHRTVPQPHPRIETRSFFSQAAHQHMLSHFQYFPMTCSPWSSTAKLPPTRQYVFAVHPHGIHCWPLNMLCFEDGPFDQIFPNLCGQKVSGLAATVLYKLPIVRELFLSMRYMDAGRDVANAALLQGQSIYVCTGGEKESLLTQRGQDLVVLSDRKGFVRLALSHGADLVPVFGAGVSDLYQTYPYFMGIRQWLERHLGIALPLFHGRWCTPLPYKTPIRVLIGEPIPTPKPNVPGEKPDPKLVEEYHAKYIAALKALHAKHVKDRTLIVV